MSEAFSTGPFSTGHTVHTSVRAESQAGFHTTMLMSESFPGQEATQVTNFPNGGGPSGPTQLQLLSRDPATSPGSAKGYPWLEGKAKSPHTCWA